MPDDKSRRALQRPAAGRDLSMEARTFAARSLRTSESRVTMRRRLASMRVGTQRRRYQRVAVEHRSLLELSGLTSEPSLVMTIAKGKTVEVNP